MKKNRKIRFGRKNLTWLRIALIVFAVLLAFFLGFVLGKPIMDLFR